MYIVFLNCNNLIDPIFLELLLFNLFVFSFLSPLRNSGINNVGGLTGYGSNYSPQLANDPLLSGSTPKGKVRTPFPINDECFYMAIHFVLNISIQ